MLQLVRARSDHIPARNDARNDAADLDEPQRAVWRAIRHLFPSHAMVTQTDYGCMLVTWTLRDGVHACTHFAAPVMIRIRPELMLALWTCDPADRAPIAAAQADDVREALAGYDPHSRVPTCGLITLGDDDS